MLASRMPAALTAAQHGATKLDTTQQRQALRLLAQQASGALWHAGAAGIRRCVACWRSRHRHCMA